MVLSSDLTEHGLWHQNELGSNPSSETTYEIREITRSLYASEPLFVNGTNTICLEEFLKGLEIIQSSEKYRLWSDGSRLELTVLLKA